MKDANDPRHLSHVPQALHRTVQTIRSKATHADQYRCLQDRDCGVKMAHTVPIQFGPFAAGQLIRSPVAPRGLKKDERTVIDHEVAGKELFGASVARGRPTPESPAAHLGAGRFPASNRPPWVLQCRPIDRSAQAHPVTDACDFAEWDTRLHHPERPGIHAEQQHRSRPACESMHILPVWAHCVAKRVVDMGDGCGESQRIDCVPQEFGGAHEVVGNAFWHGVGLLGLIGPIRPIRPIGLVGPQGSEGRSRRLGRMLRLAAEFSPRPTAQRALSAHGCPFSPDPRADPGHLLRWIASGV